MVVSRSDDPQELADAIQAAFPDLDVRSVSPQMAGRGVTWFEVFRIFLEAGREIADHVIIDALAAIMLSYLRHRFGGKPGRTKFGAIHGPDGKVVRSFTLKAADAEPEDRTAEDQALGSVGCPPPVAELSRWQKLRRWVRKLLRRRHG